MAEEQVASKYGGGLPALVVIGVGEGDIDEHFASYIFWVRREGQDPTQDMIGIEGEGLFVSWYEQVRNSSEDELLGVIGGGDFLMHFCNCQGDLPVGNAEVVLEHVIKMVMVNDNNEKGMLLMKCNL